MPNRGTRIIANVTRSRSQHRQRESHTAPVGELPRQFQTLLAGGKGSRVIILSIGDEGQVEQALGERRGIIQVSRQFDALLRQCARRGLVTLITCQERSTYERFRRARHTWIRARQQS